MDFSIFAWWNYRFYTMFFYIFNETVAVIASSAITSIESLHEFASLRTIRNDTWCDNHSARIPCASTARYIFELSPLFYVPCPGCLFCSCPVLMDFNIGSVKHQPFKIRFINKDFKKLFPKPIVPPFAKSAMCVFLVAIVQWQVALWRASS